LTMHRFELGDILAFILAGKRENETFSFGIPNLPCKRPKLLAQTSSFFFALVLTRSHRRGCVYEEVVSPIWNTTIGGKRCLTRQEKKKKEKSEMMGIVPRAGPVCWLASLLGLDRCVRPFRALLLRCATSATHVHIHARTYDTMSERWDKPNFARGTHHQHGGGDLGWRQKRRRVGK